MVLVFSIHFKWEKVLMYWVFNRIFLEYWYWVFNTLKKYWLIPCNLPCTWIHVKQNDLLLEIRLKMSIIQVVINPSSSYRIQLIQLAISEFWVSVWARFLARSARAKLSSAQLTKFKIWKSSAQLSSPNWKSISARLSSAHYLKRVSSAH